MDSLELQSANAISLGGDAYTLKIGTTSIGLTSDMFYANYCYPYWHEYYYPYVIPTVMKQEDTFKKAFKIVEKLMKEKIVKELTIKEFVALVNEIAEEL